MTNRHQHAPRVLARRGRRRNAGSQAGFTLLEVMVSLGILAVALMAIGDLNGGAVRMHSYSSRLTVAVQLARGKMLDLQTELRKDGFSDFSKEYRGDFSKEGERDFRWVAQVIRPELEVDASQLIQMGTSALGLGGEEDSGGPQNATPNPLLGGPMAGLVDGQLRQMIETIKDTVREIKLTIYWKAGGGEESFELVEHMVLLPNAAAAATQQSQPLSPTGVPPQAAPGMNLPPGVQRPIGLPFGGAPAPGGIR